MSEIFEICEARCDGINQRVMVIGCSNAGKTMSSMRLAAGMAKVTGGKFCVIDTQNKACQAYTKYFPTFDVLSLGPPFTGDRLLAAIRHAVANGAKVVVVDTLTSEHSGPGGVLEAKEAAMDMLLEQRAKRKGVSVESLTFRDEEQLAGRAWSAAKAPRKRLLENLVYIDAHIIFTVRAKKLSGMFAEKPRNGAPPKDEATGWEADTDDAFLYECPLRALLLPMSNGVPTWNPVAECEKKAIRRPIQFEELIRRFDGKALCEDMGEEMARWAIGDAKPAAPKDGGSSLVATIGTAIGNASTAEELDAVLRRVAATERQGKITAEQRATLEASGTRRRKILAGEVVE